jgi:hypothetical protein
MLFRFLNYALFLILVSFAHAQIAAAVTVKTQACNKSGKKIRHDILFHPLGKTIVVTRGKSNQKPKEKVVGDVSFVK